MKIIHLSFSKNSSLISLSALSVGAFVYLLFEESRAAHILRSKYSRIETDPVGKPLHIWQEGVKQLWIESNE